MLMLIVLILIALIPLGNVTLVMALPTRGPKTDTDIRFYPNSSAGYAALKANDIDFLQSPLTYEQKLDAEADPNLCIAAYHENGMIEFDLNNNYTVSGIYPGIRNPLTVTEFRQGLTCAVDKQYIVDEILLGAGGILNVPIPLNSITWWNETLLQANYEFKYDMVKAAQLLDAAGFADTEPDGTRNYPVGWDGAEAGGNMDPLIFYIVPEDKRYDAGQYLAGQLDILDIPYNKIEWPSDIPYPNPVLWERDYHIYTGGWSLGRYPTFLYFGYHSDYWFLGGSNCVTGMNSSNLPNYPLLDEYVRAVYFTPSIAAAQAATLKAGGYGWAELCVNIPLWSSKRFVAWRKTMPGVVNMFGYGLDNPYQFLHAYQSGGGPIRMGTIGVPKRLNPLYSVWTYDYAVLDRVFDTLLNINPYDLTVDQPWAVEDWEVGTWFDPNPGPDEPSTKSTVTYYLRKDCGIVEPETGNFIRYATAHDLEFSAWYTYCFPDAWNYPSYEDLHHSEVIDDYTIKYYFDDASYWFYDDPQYPTLCRDELIDTLCTVSSASFTSDGTNCSAGTQFKLTTENIVQVTSDDVPVDYYIYGGYEDGEHNWIMLEGDVGAGTYMINFYTDDLDPHGYYLAGLPWADTWYSFGPFYCTDIVPGVDGHAALNKNPHYWMETPPLGETDWRWWWDTPGGQPGWEISGRDSGYFQINIYDVIKATGSYCHSGDGAYDPQYFPGADLDKTDLAHIGIYDIVSITDKYGLKWAIPPP